MIFGQSWDFDPAPADDIAALITNRPTPLGEYTGAVTRQSFRSSIPGVVAGEIQVPDDDRIASTQFRSGVTRYTRTDVPLMSEEEWKASEDYREGIPFDGRMTKARAKAKAEIYDADRYDSWLRQNRPWGVGTVAAAIAGSIAGAAPDPTNYIPVFGPAFRIANASRGATILARAGVGAAENMAITAMQAPLIAESRRQFGDDVFFADQIMDIALAGLFGAGVGAIAGRFERLPDRAPNRVSTALQTLGEAAEALANDRPLNIMGAYRTALMHGTSLGRTPDLPEAVGMQRSGAPAGTSAGPVLDPDLGNVSRASGLNAPSFSGALEIPVKRPNGETAVYPSDLTGFKSEISKLTKAAEREGRALELRDLPDGRKELVETSKVEWTDQFPDEQSARNNLNRMTPDERKGVDIVPVTTQARGKGFALIKGATKQQVEAIRANPALAERIRTDTAAPEAPAVRGPEARETFGQAIAATAPDLRTKATAPRSISSIAPDTSVTTPDRIAQADQSVGKPQTFTDAGAKEQAAEHGIDESGNFEEMADIQRLDQSGQLTAEEKAILAEADETVKRTEDYAKAYQAAASCMARP